MNPVIHFKDEPATEAQLAYIEDLSHQRQLTDVQKQWLEAHWDILSKSDASRIIDGMRKLPKLVEHKDWPNVPAGRYAVENEDGILRFYHVDRPAAGRWAGYTFLSVRASDELYPIKAPDAKKAILMKIAEDPREASLRFGREIGQCGVCGRTLTDPTSIELGIGPICRKAMDW